MISVIAWLAMFGTGQPATAEPPALIDEGWGELAPIPDPLGVAGPFVGVAGDRLVVAGGANFAEGRRPWQGGKKTWRDAIFVLDAPDGHWRTAATPLPRPLGYGVSITTSEGLWCIGGSDQNQHYSDVFLMTVDRNDVRIHSQPALPVPLANSCGALVGSRLIVAGGTETPTATSATQHVFVLDTALAPAERAWQTLAAWPGPARMLATAGAAGNDFYLFGGVDLTADANGAPVRIKPFLTDAWKLRFDAAGGAAWERLADLPAPRVAAPTPAPLFPGHRLLLISGDDGTLSAAEEDRHTGFPATTLVYDIERNQWTSGTPILCWNGTAPDTRPEECVWPPVTTGTAVWNKLLIIPTGEIRPGVRTRRVLTAGTDILD